MPALQVVGGEPHVFLGHALQLDPFLRRQFARHFGRRTQHQRAGRNPRAGRDQGARANERLLADDRAVQE